MKIALLVRSQEFLRAGELSENKCENSNFFSAIKLNVDITVGFFPDSGFWLWCSLTSNIKEIEYCVMNVKVGRGGFHPVAANSQTANRFFQKWISHSTKYSITSTHAAWTYSYKKRKAFLILMAWSTAAFVNTSPT